MSFEKMSSAEERRIMSALETAVRDANKGVDPNTAIRKAAEADRMTIPVVQRMVEAFNTGRMLAHLKRASGAARAASFPLADAATVVAQMYPEKVSLNKAAEVVAEEYGRPEPSNFNRPEPDYISDWPKAAEALPAYPQDAVYAADRAYGRLHDLRKQADAARVRATGTSYDVASAIGDVARYFRRTDRLPFEEVAIKTAAQYGDFGRTLMEAVYNLAGLTEAWNIKVASHRMVVDLRKQPYDLIKRAADALEEMVKVAEAAADAELEYEKAAEVLPGATLPTRTKETGPYAGIFDAPTIEKSAFEGLEALSPLSMGIQPGLDVLGLGGKPEDSVSALDPGHESVMQAARTKAMLNDFMSHDPVLSQHDPAKVAEAYNTLSRMAPSVAQQPMVARDMIRKLLEREGSMESFEAKDTSTLERQLRDLTAGEPAES